MSNKELIEQLQYNFGRQFAAPELLWRAADALELADKRIAELERKLAIAREALKSFTEYEAACEERDDSGAMLAYAECQIAINEALAQIGGEDAGR